MKTRLLHLIAFLVSLLLSPAAIAATRTWDGGGDGNSWTNAANWSADTVPVAGDDVVIDVVGTNATIRYTGGSVTLSSLRCEENFSLLAGGITVTNGASWSHGGLLMAADGALTVQRAGTSFTSTGDVAINGAHLSAQSGATLSLPTLANYTDTSGCCGSLFEAVGAASLLDLPALTNLTGNPSWSMTVRSLSGGQVNVSNLARINDSLVYVLADGINSSVKLDALTTHTNGRVIFLEARNNGSIQSSNLVDASRVEFSIGTTGNLPTAQLARLFSFTVNGQNRVLPAVTNMDGGSLIALGGATISLPALATYSDTAGCCGSDWQANGAGSTVSLPGLTNLNGNPTWAMNVRALAGGQVQLAAANRVSDGHVNFLADGAGSVVALPMLATQSNPGRILSFEARNLGSIQTPLLVDGAGATFTLRTGGSLSLSQLNRSRGFTIQGTNLSLPALTNLDGASISVSSGATLALPGLTRFTDTAGCCGVLWEANGPGAVLSFPALTNLAGNPTWTPTIRALAGGQIQLGAVTQIPDSYLYFLADGTNSLVNLGSLAAYNGPARTISFEARNAGSISAPLLVDGAWSSFAVRSGATLNLNQLTRFAGLTVDGGLLNLPAVTNINGANLSVTGGGNLTLPGIAQYADTGGCCGALWEATGSGSSLSLPALTSLAGNAAWTMTVRSTAGGRIHLGAVALIPESNLSFLSDGVGSRVVLSNLTSYASIGKSGWFEARNSGVLELTPGPFSATRATVTVQSNGDIQTGSLALYPGSILQGNGLFDADVFNQGGTIAAGTSAGVLTLASNLVQSSGTILAEIGGAVAGTNYDRIVVNGSASLNGTLQISRLNNFVPNITNTFVLLTATNVTGGFTNFIGLDAGGSLEFVPGVSSSNVSLSMAFSSGPRIIGLFPTNAVSNVLSSFTVTFSEPIVAGTFTAADVVLTGPSGNIPITAIDPLGQSNSVIRFAAHATQGNYSLAVGPNITDVAGNLMNQDGDSTNGEAAQDAFQTVVALTDNAPPTVASVTPSGGVINNVSSLSIVFNEPLLAGTFTAADVSLSGPSGSIPLTTLTSSDDKTWTAAFATQSTQGTYAFSIGPNLQDSQGNNMVAAYPGTFTIDRSGPVVTGMTPSGSITQAVAFVDLAFSEVLNAATFTTADATLTGPSGVVGLASVSGIGGSTYRIAFPQQASSGTYTLIVGPTISDPAGNLMNQDGDATFGEATQDRYTNSFTVSSPDIAVLAVAGPTNALPGQIITVSWQLTNSGNAPVSRTIAEVVSLSSDAAISNDFRVAVFAMTNVLAPGEWLGRTQQVTMPVNGPAGILRLVVHADANDEVPEGNETNNLAIASETITVPLALSLQLAETSITEGGVSGAIISRNGASTAALLVTLNSLDTTELTAPAAVTIPAGQTEAAFNLTAVIDGIPDGPQPVSLLASGSSFLTATGTVTVLDADIPTLSLIVSNALVVEGQTGFASVTRQGSTASPLIVVLGSSSPGQLTVPASVTIPAGQSSAAFSTFAVDDAYVESTRGYTVTAGAAGLVTASGTVTVVDNDQPTLLLSLDQPQIREGAGPDAATLTISRIVGAPIPVEVLVTAGIPNELLFAGSVTFAPTELVKRVPLSPRDDLLIEPNRTVVLLVRALETLSLSPIAPGVSTNIVILDDDGPFLRLAFSRDWVCDGQGPSSPLASVTATLTRSVPTNVITTVALSSDVTGLLTLPASLEIPAGATQAVFNVGLGTNTPGGTAQSVVVTASATGVSSAVAALQRRTDCQPDLVISSLVTPTNGVTDAYFSVNFREINVGAAFAVTNHAPGVTNISQKVYLSTDPYPGGDTFVGSVTFNGQVNPYAFLDRNATFRLPSVPGNYWVVVEADGSNDVAEASEGNNFVVSPLPILVDAAYTATVAASFESAPAGTPVGLSGTVRKFGTLLPAPFELVNLHLGLRGTTRIISALSDADGNFSATFTPLPGEAGTYTVGAAHPGVTNGVPAQDTFTLVGMRANPATLALVVPALTTVTQTVSLSNLGDVGLSGLNLSVFGLPPEFSASATIPGSLAPFASTDLSLVLGVTTDTNLTRTFTVRATSLEGAVADVLVTLTAQSLRPRLVAVPGSLSAGVVPGSQRFIEFTVVNQGGAASGPLTVQPPVFPFLRVLSPPALPALAPGASNIVSLQLAPSADQTLGLYAGDLLVTDGAASVAVPTQFRIVSTNTGSLLVEVTDQFTYYAEGAPHVTNAVVELKDPYTGTVLLTRTNDAFGFAVFTNLTEGYYSVGVTAAEHEPFATTLFVSAATTAYQEALMNRETVQFFWNVTPTELGDRTKLTIEAVFETVVPVPVLTVSPSVIDLANYPNGGSINLTITNHGLLAAQAVQLAFSQFDCWRITPLISDVGTLAARSSITIPVAICRDLTCSGNFANCPVGGGVGSQISLSSKRKSIDRVLADVRGQSSAGGSGCGGGGLTYLVPCGNGSVGGSAPVGVANAGGGGCGGGPGGGATGGGGGSGSIIVSGGGAGNCNPCAAELAATAAGCVLNWVLPLPDILSCLQDSYECYQEPSVLGCAGALVSCLEAAGKEVPLLGDILDALSCADDLLSACGGPGLGGGLGGGGGATPSSLRQLSSKRKLHDATVQPFPGMAEVELGGGHVLAVLGVYSNFFGGQQWLVAASGTRFGDWMTLLKSGIDSAGESGTRISANERNSLTSSPLTNDISAADINRFLDRWNRTIDYQGLGILYSTNVPPNQSTDFIAVDLQRRHLALARQATLEAQTNGHANVFEELRDSMLRLRAFVLQPSGGICAQVRLRIDQEAVIARDAFRASLEIVNDSSSPMSNITVNLMVTDSAGRIVNPLFAIPSPALAGIGSVTGTGLVGAGGRGTAAWTIVPTTESAPTDEIVYYVSGSIRYTQNGAATVVPLAAQSITVHPLAQLHVSYFHQRDVLGDDPFTDVVEPSVPYSLATMIRNTGAGTARNVRITSAQPKIIENEKGLFIDFQIIATEVAGQNVLPSLTANFGDIGPGSIKIGRWLLKSTLQGLFVDYSASFEHLDDLGDPRASIIQSVDIRELIRIVSAPGVFQDNLPDMLANDFQDIEDLPDTLYLSDGSVHHVSIVTTGAITGALSTGNLQVTLNAGLPGGWSYLRVPDPGSGLYRLKQVIRSDNVALSVGTNAWTTDRTFVGGGKKPVLEKNLHLVDFNGPGSYTLVYETLPSPDLTPPVSAVAALPAGSFPQIPLIWTGTDGGSGIASFDIHVSDNGGPSTLWLDNTPLFGAVYPGTFGHTYTFYSVAQDQAGNTETAPVSPDAMTVVNRVNSAPVLTVSTNVVVPEGTTVLLGNGATDADSDVQTVTFSLTAGAPPNASINPASGLVTWPTGEGTGPSTNVIGIVATDSGSPALSATGLVTVVVNEVNQAPFITSAGPFTIREGVQFNHTFTAVDSDLPTNSVRWSLGAGAPPGTAIGTNTGLFSWTPTPLQGPSTNSIQIIATDSGQPALATSRFVTVVVRDSQGDFILSVGATNLFVGQSNSVAVQFNAGVDLATVSFSLTTDDLRLTDWLLRNVSPQVGSSSLVPSGTNRVSVSFAALPGQTLPIGIPLASFDFRSLSNAPSGFVRLQPLGMQAQLTGGTLLTNGIAYSGRVVVIGEQPLLDALNFSVRELILWGNPGRTYRIDFIPEIGAAWQPWRTNSPVGPRTPLPAHENLSPVFYRAVLLPAAP